ncbi:Hypothetical predicted protein [Lecanosticta acicola]|uniref:Uncharacterized protein n=1 Tax=Lecanosticta acicola TaxID=111012 RepID=A0AAI9EAA9_9PEZI|nr:Hypothetical predicted protein [Lecanosticta acicola]
MGFTAINNSYAPSSTTTAASVDSEIVSSPSNAPRSVASEYLGRGQEQPHEQLAASSKKGNANSKKRAAPARGASNSKKRRTSSVKDVLTVRKSADERPLVPEDYSVKARSDAAKPAKTKKQSSKGKHAHVGEAVSVEKDQSAPTATKPISVYAPTTSMNALDSTPAQTSFNSIKENAGKSFTLYSGTESSSSAPTNVAFSQRWLPPTFEYRSVGLDSSQNQSRGSDENDNDRSKDTTGSRADEPILVRDADCDPRRSPGLTKATNFLPSISSDEFHDIEELIDVDDEDLVNFAKSVEQAVGDWPSTPTKRARKDNIRDVDEHEDYGGALLTQAEKDVIKQMDAKREKTIKPILRKPFLPPILDRSPIFGASKNTLLRTCFRVGEALNTGCQAVRCGNNVIIELYARVTASWREPKPSRKQHFMFKDLYHNNPPHLNGTYELWDQSQLWDRDSKPFLSANDGQGKICRMIGKMRRDGRLWRIEILSIWEASWEDVDYVAGVYIDRVLGDDEDGDDE